MKKFLYIFAFILCFTFVSCNWNSKTENYSETGTVKINLSNSQRTVAPNVNWSLPNTTDSSAWQGWRFVFTNEKNETTEIADRFPSDYQLIVGNYTLEVYGNIVQTSSGTGGTSTGGDTTIGSSTTTTGTTGTVSTGGTGTVIEGGTGTVGGTTIQVYGKSKEFTVSANQEISVSVLMGLSKLGTGSFDYTLNLTSDFFMNDPNPKFQVTLTSMDGSNIIEFKEAESASNPDSKTEQLYSYSFKDNTLMINGSSVPSGYYKLSIEYLKDSNPVKILISDDLIEIADGQVTSYTETEISNYNRTYYATNDESVGNGIISDARINFIDLLTKIADENSYISANVYCNFKPDFEDSDFQEIVKRIDNSVISIRYGSSDSPIPVGYIRNGNLELQELDTTVTDIGTYLSRLPSNSPEDPYNIVINDATEYTASVLKTSLASSFGPYINLDLSTTKMTEFEVYGLKDCTHLISIKLPETLTILNDNGFDGCSNLKEVILPSNLDEINGYSFSGCSALEHIEIPASVTKFHGFVFSGSGLKTLTFNGVLPTFDDSPFSGCYYLTSVYVPVGAQIADLARKLPEQAEIIQEKILVNELDLYLSEFAANTKDNPYYFVFAEVNPDFDLLPDIFVNNYDKFLYLNLSNCTDITIMGSSEDTESTNVFGGYENLVGIDLPPTLTEIGAYCFYNSGLQSVTIPSTVQIINLGAFANCVDLTELIFESSEPPTIMATGCFDNETIGSPTITTIRVPTGSKDAYHSKFLTDVDGCYTLYEESFLVEY